MLLQRNDIDPQFSRNGKRMDIENNATHISRVSLKTIFVWRRMIGISGSMGAIIRVINYSILLCRSVLSRKRSSEALRSHLASWYYISIYRSIYRQVIEVRAAPTRCNIDDTLAARGTVVTQDEGYAQRGTGREKENDIEGARENRQGNDIV